MNKNNAETVLGAFEGVASRDLGLATKHLHPDRYTQHDPCAAGGAEGRRQSIGQLPRESHLQVACAFEDGRYVFTQADGQIYDQNN